jgi:Holliday junction resolvase RusA-like endonuclease
MIKLTLPIAPVAKERARVTQWGNYTPPKTKAFESACRAMMLKLLGPTTPRRGPIKLTARFILVPPKRPKYKEPAVRPDLDNYLKGIKDAANGVLWHDDGQVVHIDARKLYDMTGAGPRIELEVSEIG